MPEATPRALTTWRDRSRTTFAASMPHRFVTTRPWPNLWPNPGSSAADAGPFRVLPCTALVPPRPGDHLRTSTDASTVLDAMGANPAAAEGRGYGWFDATCPAAPTNSRPAVSPEPT